MMMSDQDINKDFDTIFQECAAKVDQAVKLLEEVKETFTANNMGSPRYHDNWRALRLVMEAFIPDVNQGWDPSSSWCGETAWDNSGCSF
jgi:hypothetical protein